MAQLKIGTTNIFKVRKKEDEGYLLEHEEATIMMPFKEAVNPVDEGDELEAFVYIDHTKGLVATTKTPYIDIYNPDFVKVVEQKLGLGVFVDIGLTKDMLVSKDDLPPLKKDWPQIGDTLLCYLKTAKRQMVARPLSRFRVRDYLRPEKPLEKGEAVEAIVFHVADEGLVTFTKSGHEIFIYYKHTRAEHRMGETVKPVITIKKDETHYNGTLIEQKELMLEKDAQTVYDYLRENKEMPLTDKSTPQAIHDTFNMSKAAFKRALGQLYKQGRIDLKKDKTVLKDEEQD